MKNKSLALLFGGILLAGCANDDFNFDARTDGQISFNSSLRNNETRSAQNEGSSFKVISEKGESLDVFLEETPWEKTRGTRGIPLDSEKGTFNEFEVFAYLYKTESTTTPSFYFNSDIKLQNGKWVYAPVYYWPSDESQKLAFLGVSGHKKTDCGVTLTPPSSEGEAVISYAVPDDAAKHPDIVIGTADKCNHVKGGQSVNMNDFTHLLSKVTFHIGNEMQKGIIKSVKITNLVAQSTYSHSTKSWTHDTSADKKSFVVNSDKSVEETDAGKGIPIIDEEHTMFMIPQAIGEGESQLEVEFQNESGETNIYSAAVPEMTLRMGTSYVFNINIEPEGSFTIELKDKPDSHYTRFPVTVTPEMVKGNWVVEVENGKDWCSLRKEIVGEEVNGYWIAKEYAVDYSQIHFGINEYDDPAGPDYTRHPSLSFSDNEPAMLYVFMEENATTSSRSVNLMVYPEGKKGINCETIEITQPGLVDINGVLWESIEESEQVEWGFKWDRKITYDAPNWKDDHQNAVKFKNYFRLAQAGQYGSVVKASNVNFKNGSITFDYSGLSPQAYDENNGLNNTIVLKNTLPALIMELETTLLNIGAKAGDPVGEIKIIHKYASAEAVKKNAFKLTQDADNQDSAISYVYLPKIDDGAIKWYLPAIKQFPGVGTTEPTYDTWTPFDGTYWSSTGVNDGTNAKTWTNGTEDKSARVNINHKVRAVRKQE